MKNILYLSLIFYPLFGFSVRHVGNGGGLAEMTALSSFRQISVLANACMTHQIDCQMNQTQTKEQELLLTKTSEFTQWKVIFQAQKKGPPYFHDGENISINNTYLYNLDESPKNQNEILAFIWALIWTEYSGRNFNEAYRVTLNITSLYSNKSQIYSFSENSSGLQLHFLDLYNETQKYHIQNLFLEYPKVTMDLTSDLERALRCGNPYWSVLSKRSEQLSESLFRFQADIKWVCKAPQQETWYGKLVILIPSNTDEPTSNTIKINIIGRILQ
jgi:hypothetical protein